ALRGKAGTALFEVLQNRRRPWHLEAEHDGGQRPEVVRVEVEVGLHDVAVEGHVECLVLGDSPEGRAERRILALASSRGARRKGEVRGLWTCRLPHPYEGSGEGVSPARRDHCLPGLRPRVVIPAPADQQVALEQRRVLVLLRGPEADEFLDRTGAG